MSTIAAISTPPGAGGIAILRLSGERAHSIVSRIFRPWPHNPQYFHLYLGYIHDPVSDCRLDQVLMALMPEKGSYTGEAVAEIHCHGGTYLARKILDLLFSLGAEPAAPGEFTRRAYLNGRLDLAQAEAVAGLIAAESEAGLNAAAAQLAGGLSRRVEDLLAELEDILAGIEVEIDLLAEEGDNYRHENLAGRLAGLLRRGEELASGYERGRLSREGLRVVLAGRPNVGKSSLLNALLAEDRALVSQVAGTTRDVISASIEVAGVKIELADTAGLDEPRDELEALGMARTRSWLERADLVILVLDHSRPLSDADYELYQQIKEKPHLLVLNKQDLPGRCTAAEISRRLASRAPVLRCVADREGSDIRELVAALSDFVTARHPAESSGIVISSRRHYDLLCAFVAALRRARELSLVPEPFLDLLAEELHQARKALLAIVGRDSEAVESLLDTVFAGFCVGK